MSNVKSIRSNVQCQKSIRSNVKCQDSIRLILTERTSGVPQVIFMILSLLVSLKCIIPQLSSSCSLFHQLGDWALTLSLTYLPTYLPTHPQSVFEQHYGCLIAFQSPSYIHHQPGIVIVALFIILLNTVKESLKKQLNLGFCPNPLDHHAPIPCDKIQFLTKCFSLIFQTKSHGFLPFFCMFPSH